MTLTTIIQLVAGLAGMGLFGKGAYDWYQSRKAAGSLPSASTALTTITGALQGEIVTDADLEQERLRAALKLLACHIACNVDDPAEQTEALAACRTIKKHVPQKPSGRTEATTDAQADLLAAVQRYNADRITAVG